VHGTVLAVVLRGRRPDKPFRKLKGRQPHQTSLSQNSPAGCLPLSHMAASLSGLLGSDTHSYLWKDCLLRRADVNLGKRSDKSPRSSEAPREGGTYGETCGGDSQFR
jgi:hypothetical protein